jgi:hypothetical protein
MLVTCGTHPDSESAILISMVTDDERMQRESSLIATVRKKLPDFAKACA